MLLQDLLPILVVQLITGFITGKAFPDCSGPRTPVLATVVNDPPVCPGNLSACVNDPAFVLPEGTPAGGTF
ncbi:MAG: hypothetical protein R2769_07410 [Saprospiraceae bacterium]